MARRVYVLRGGVFFDEEVSTGLLMRGQEKAAYRCYLAATYGKWIYHDPPWAFELQDDIERRERCSG